MVNTINFTLCVFDHNSKFVIINKGKVNVVSGISITVTFGHEGSFGGSREALFPDLGGKNMNVLFSEN